jgi:hypothetical protein
MSDYIESVDSGTLANARATGALDPGSLALVAAESEYLERRRAYYHFASGQGSPRRTALALSGGGIRSAAFALGIMQRLAKNDYLRLFDYLSTVSGGGYIGCSITWLTSQIFRRHSQLDLGLRNCDVGAAPFPYGSDDPRAPVWRHPPTHEDKFLTYLRSHGQYLIPGDGITLLSGIAVVLRGILLNLLVWFPIAVAIMVVAKLPLFDVQRFGFNIALFLAEICGSAFALASIVYSFYTFRKRSPQASRYRVRRRFEIYARLIVLFALAFTVFGTLPWIADFLEGWVAETGTVALITGIAGGLRGFVKSRGADAEGGTGGMPLGVLASISAVLFCYGFLLLAFFAADSMKLWGWEAQLIAAAIMLLFSSLLGCFTNLNYLTLHRYYRDRLMEAFMPDMERVEENNAGPAFVADPVPLSDMCSGVIGEPRGPYHIINAHLILTGTGDKTRKARGGDSFILTPRYCGSNATGWRRTDEFASNEITLPTAMAISGAAANPNAGSAGTGVTRNPIVAIVMSLFNVRLGYWVPNPKRQRQNIRPNHFNPGLTDLIDYQRDESSYVLRLSDGGHFENLGLYELIRRRVEVIVCCDAGADPDYAFSDLTNAIVRAEQDFGAVIKFEDPELSFLMPSGILDFPRRSPFSRRAHARACITYADGSTGTLIYLTTVIIRELRLQLLGYMGAHPAFPDETTVDQFFDEAQFEAYRELGFAVADRMLADPGRAASAGEPGTRGFADEFTDRLTRLSAMAPVTAVAAQ